MLISNNNSKDFSNFSKFFNQTFKVTFLELQKFYKSNLFSNNIPLLLKKQKVSYSNNNNIFANKNIFTNKDIFAVNNLRDNSNLDTSILFNLMQSIYNLKKKSIGYLNSLESYKYLDTILSKKNSI